MKMKWGTALVLSFCLTGLASAQTQNLDPEILTGVLPDGMTYFIEKNPKPMHRVQLSLIVHAGSVLENPDQRGIAHLLEHMEFQGTEHFAPQAIVNFLEANGMRFGADLNAQTGFTSTQYFLELPTDKPEIFKTGLQILEDWAKGPKIVPSVLENEKKVVMEEARLRMNNVRGRITDFVVPFVYGGSPYADRLPIGSMEVVKNATPQTVEDFCHAWYRPENMAIVLVGDIDPVAVQKEVLAEFTSPIRDATHAITSDAPGPTYRGRTAQVFQDKEMSIPEIEWTTTEETPLSSYQAFRHFQLLNDLASRILNNRLSELTRSAAPPFQDAGVYGRLSFGNSWERTFVVEPYDGKATQGVEAFTRELERAQANGFTATDFRLAVDELRSEIETAWAQRGGITDEDRVSALASYFLTRLPVVGDQAEHDVGLKELSSIDLDELNAFARRVFTFPDFRMVVLTPQKAGVPAPSADQILGVIARVQATAVAQVEERTVVPLLDRPPTPGKIVRETTLPELGVTVFTLANGATVMAKKTDFTPNEILVRGERLGGLSLVGDDDLLSVEQAASAFSQTGLGRLNETQLSDFLSGKQAQLQVTLGTSEVYLSGSTTKTDLETFFQMLHEQLGPPHRDGDAEKAWRDQTRDYLSNSQNLPTTLAENEKNRLLTDGSPRSLPLTTDRLKKVDLDRAAKIYTELVGNPNGLLLAVVGDFDETQLKRLIETYVASIAPGPKTLPVDLGIRPAAGPVRSVIAKGTDDKAENSLFMINPRPFRPDDRFAANTLREILDIRLRDVLRNQNGGTYDAESAVSLSPLPYPHATVVVQFTCEPSRQVELTDKALGVLSSVARGNFDDATLEKAKAIQVRGVESYLKQNNFWSAILPEYSLNGYDLGELARLKELYAAVTRDQVAKLAQEVLTGDKALQIVLEPEKK